MLYVIMQEKFSSYFVFLFFNFNWQQQHHLGTVILRKLSQAFIEEKKTIFFVISLDFILVPLKHAFNLILCAFVRLMV